VAVITGAVLALAVLAALAAQQPHETKPEGAPRETKPESAAQFAGRKVVWTEENGSAVRDLELYVDAEPVRALRPRPGVYVYETPVLPLSDGAMWERYVYNVTCAGDVCTIVRTVYTYIVQGGRTMESLPRVETYVVRNGTLWELQMESGNWTFISNRVVPPVSKLSVCILVAPPFFAYVEAGRRFTVTYTYNATFLMPHFLGAGHTWSIHETVREAFQVDRDAVRCNGPTGLCYAVRARATESYRSVTRYDDGRRKWGGGRDEYEYVWLVDMSGVVVRAERWRHGRLMVAFTLVEWR
jgi:hypothetical protein